MLLLQVVTAKQIKNMGRRILKEVIGQFESLHKKSG
jgi:hypothetical protein